MDQEEIQETLDTLNDEIKGAAPKVDISLASGMAVKYSQKTPNLIAAYDHFAKQSTSSLKKVRLVRSDSPDPLTVWDPYPVPRDPI